jgi:hypothetical protein
VTTTESFWRLGRASFSILFLELALIRWIPSYVRLFGYFTNFILLGFAPIFVANIVFSRSFRDTERADSAFASNLLSITVGGLVEYAALVAGYQALLLPVMAFYGVSLFLERRSAPEHKT